MLVLARWPRWRSCCWPDRAPAAVRSVDEGVARARGVPTRALGIGFLLLLGMAVAETAQITGALLVFALLVATAGHRPAAHGPHRARPALSVALGVLVTWVGLALAYFYEYPVGFYITTVAFVMYVLARAGRRSRRPLRGRFALMFAQEFFRNALLAGQLRRAGLRAGRLLRRAAGTGVRRRRTQPRRLHRRGRSGGGRPRHARRPVRSHDLGRLVLGVIGPRAGADDVAIGVLFAWVLGLGVLFLALFSGGSSGGDGVLGARALFGSIFGLSGADARLAAGVGAGIAIAVLGIARPLLFASVDPIVASARGVRVRASGLRSWRSSARPPRRPPRPWGRC